MKKILYVYKWATMGGVERVLINRALAFKKFNIPVKQDVFFYHDSGGKEMLRASIVDYGIQKYLNIIDFINNDEYDYIHSIDTPEIFNEPVDLEKLIFECHTSYKENRGYLKSLPEKLKGLVVPSETFKKEIYDEIPSFIKKKTYVISNCLPNAREAISQRQVLNKIPVTYIGRTDSLKNVEEIIMIFKELLEKLGDKFILFIAGPIMKEVDLFDIVKKNNLENRFIYLPSISFEKMEELLNFIRCNNGIVVSASKGESFGLSIAEAINANIPVVATMVHAHLVNSNDKFLYKQGNITEAINKITNIYYDRNSTEQKLPTFKRNFNEDRFIEDWNKIYYK